MSKRSEDETAAPSGDDIQQLARDYLDLWEQQIKALVPTLDFAVLRGGKRKPPNPVNGAGSVALQAVSATRESFHLPLPPGCC